MIGLRQMQGRANTARGPELLTIPVTRMPFKIQFQPWNLNFKTYNFENVYRLCIHCPQVCPLGLHYLGGFRKVAWTVLSCPLMYNQNWYSYRFFSTYDNGPSISATETPWGRMSIRTGGFSLVFLWFWVARESAEGIAVAFRLTDDRGLQLTSRFIY